MIRITVLKIFFIKLTCIILYHVVKRETVFMINKKDTQLRVLFVSLVYFTIYFLSRKDSITSSTSPYVFASCEDI